MTLKNLVYKGEMEMLSLDVLALLDSDHTSLHVKHDLGVTQSVDSRQLECWLVKLVEVKQHSLWLSPSASLLLELFSLQKYLDAQAGKVQCVRRSPQHYELKVGHLPLTSTASVCRHLSFEHCDCCRESQVVVALVDEASTFTNVPLIHHLFTRASAYLSLLGTCEE